MAHGAEGETAVQTRAGSNLLINAAALVVIMAGLRAAESVVVPVLVAVFLAVISFPAIEWLCSKRIPLAVAVSLVLLAAVLMLGGLGLVVSQSAQSFTNNLPRYEEKLAVQVASLRTWVEESGFDLDIPIPPASELVSTSSIVSITGMMVAGLGLLLTNTLLILLYYVFILFEAQSFPKRVSRAFGDENTTLEHLGHMAAKMKHYLALKALMSLATGLPVYLVLKLIGVDYPVLWGLLAFLLNFIPNIGSAIAAIPPSLLALVQFGPGTALAVVAAFIVINMVTGNIIEPRVMGSGLGISTFVVLVALVFWGWAFGTVGMFLAVPLTIMVQIVLASLPETRRFAILLGGELGEEAAAVDKDTDGGEPEPINEPEPANESEPAGA